MLEGVHRVAQSDREHNLRDDRPTRRAQTKGRLDEIGTAREVEQLSKRQAKSSQADVP